MASLHDGGPSMSMHNLKHPNSAVTRDFADCLFLFEMDDMFSISIQPYGLTVAGLPDTKL